MVFQACGHRIFTESIVPPPMSCQTKKQNSHNNLNRNRSYSTPTREQPWPYFMDKIDICASLAARFRLAAPWHWENASSLPTLPITENKVVTSQSFTCVFQPFPRVKLSMQLINVQIETDLRHCQDHCALYNRIWSRSPSAFATLVFV